MMNEVMAKNEFKSTHFCWINISLKGRNMDNCFPKKNDLLCREMVHHSSEDIILKSCSENKISLTYNNWCKHYYEYMKRVCHSVQVMEHLCQIPFTNT